MKRIPSLVTGAMLIGSQERHNPGGFRAVNPATGEAFGPEVSEARDEDIAEACALAANASKTFGALDPDERAAFIDKTAQAILDIGDVLIETAMAESGLPRVRLEGERMRTVSQLRLFANEVRKGEFLDATIDMGQPDQTPPRVDLRRMNVPLGPVAVFGASNFPLAFSVAGGDTAAAFAAGCPVIVKGHPAHPGTGELVARAIADAVGSSALPEGVFSYLPGRANALGAALVADPRIKAVAFTGSRIGGMALVDIAARRPEPIPVFAEMSSVNPVFLLPRALDADAEGIAAAFVGSLTLGAGQFCTNPGLIIGIEGGNLDRFVACSVEALAAVEPAVMLTPGIHAAFHRGVGALDAGPVVREDRRRSADSPNRCAGALFTTSADQFLANPALGTEVFGSSAVIVRCKNLEEIARVVDALEGQLTATLQMADGDEGDAARLIPLLRDKAGRVLANGWPTGVEVTHAMVHGGPYPATSDSRTTSVGTLAMMRFLRPVCYQSLPDALLPAALRNANPWRLPRRIDGNREASV